MSDNLIAVIIGIVEGLTEFLPISSTGHMILVGELLDFTGEKAKVFEIVIQLGAILSVFILYRDKFMRVLDPRNLKLRTALTAYHIAAGIVPVMGIAYLTRNLIKTYLFSPFTVVIGLVAGGFLMLLAEKTAKQPRTQDVEDISIRQAFFVGLFQILSLWPGFSRSGSTIAGGLFLGMSRKAAAEFSFIIAVPIMLVACIYEMLKIWEQLSVGEIQFFAIGFITAFVMAYLSIVWFLGFLNRCTLAAFAYYRFVLAAVAYWYLIS